MSQEVPFLFSISKRKIVTFVVFQSSFEWNLNGMMERRSLLKYLFKFNDRKIFINTITRYQMVQCHALFREEQVKSWLPMYLILRIILSCYYIKGI